MNQAAATFHRYHRAELDLLSVLEVVLSRAPKLLKSGVPNQAFFKAANAALQKPDTEADGVGYVQVEFWLALARDLELVANLDGKLEATGRADDFFAGSPTGRMNELREAWLNSREMNEFALNPALELPALKRGRIVETASDIPIPERLMQARRELVALVSTLPGETALPGLIRRIKAEAPNLLIDHDQDGSWRQVFYRGIRERGGREDLERSGNWELVEGAVIRLMCELPLDRLGWLEHDERTDTVTPLNEGQADEPSFEVVVQPNFEVMALGDRPDVGALWRLARFTTPASEGRVRRYVLERKPFSEALGRGESAEELTEFLASLSRSPLPQNVQFSLRDWASLSERIKIWPDALFIEAEGVENLADSLPRALLERLQPAPVSGGHFAVPAPDAATLREVVPPRRAVLDYSRRLPAVIAPTETTDLHAPREELHLRARQLIALVSRSLSTDRYVLDPELVAQSAAAIGPAELLRRLREGLSKPLSAPLALALRTWSGEFPRPYAGAAEVLLAENTEQAALIDELPDFRRWVDRRLAPGVWLMRKGGAPEARKVLEAIGIVLRDDPRGR